MKRSLHILVLALAVATVAAVTAPGAAAGITVYVDRDYKGDSIQIDSAVPDLRALDFDDRISSLKADEVWLVCSAPRFKGDCREVEGEIVNLRQEGMNDRITSLRPAKHRGKRAPRERGEGRRGAAAAPAIHLAAGSTQEWWGGAAEGAAFRPSAGAPAGRARIRVFTERDFGGSWSRFHGPVADLEDATVRSVIVENGSWEICTLPAFGGDCRIFHDSSEDLDEWSDRVASLRPAD